ncbi:hypothetical protein [Enterobacter bugandensis]
MLQDISAFYRLHIITTSPLGFGMSIPSFINNVWFVGIIGGVLSGLVSTWIIQKLFSGKNKKEYLRKVDSTNKEIVYSLRSAISDDVHHTPMVINGLISSTARKNGVLTKDVYSIRKIAEDLIKEVMDSSFISSQYKKAYCDNLIRIYFNLDEKNKTNNESSDNKEKVTSKFDESVTFTASISVGILAAISTLLLTFLNDKSSAIDSLSSKLFNETGEVFNLIINVILPIVATTATLFVVLIVQRIYKKEQRRVINNINIKYSDKNQPSENTDEIKKE